MPECLASRAKQHPHASNTDSSNPARSGAPAATLLHEAPHNAATDLLAETGCGPHSARQLRHSDVPVVGDRFDAFQFIRAGDISAAPLLPRALRLWLRWRGRVLGLRQQAGHVGIGNSHRFSGGQTPCSDVRLVAPSRRRRSATARLHSRNDAKANHAAWTTSSATISGALRCGRSR